MAIQYNRDMLIRKAYRFKLRVNHQQPFGPHLRYYILASKDGNLAARLHQLLWLYPLCVEQDAGHESVPPGTQTGVAVVPGNETLVSYPTI